MTNILIIGCGLLGSSLLRRIHKKRLANKIFVYEKSKKNILKIKKLKLPATIVKKPEDVVAKSTGSSIPHNMIKATFDDLTRIGSPRAVAGKRGNKVAEIFGRNSNDGEPSRT